MKCNYCIFYKKECELFGKVKPTFLRTIEGCNLYFNQAKKLQELKKDRNSFNNYLRRLEIERMIYTKRE